MIYLTQFLGVPVLDLRQRPVGIVEDFLFLWPQDDACPQVMEIVVRRGKALRRAVWEDVRSLTLVQAELDSDWRKLKPHLAVSATAFLGREILNRQVVDEDWQPVGKLTDLALERKEAALLVSHIEVVGETFWHRLGLMRIRNILVPRLREHGKRSLAPWREVSWDADRSVFQVNGDLVEHLHPEEIAQLLRKMPPYLRRDFLFSLDGDEVAELFGAFDTQARLDLGFPLELDKVSKSTDK